jgi:hypothetical protein
MTTPTRVSFLEAPTTQQRSSASIGASIDYTSTTALSSASISGDGGVLATGRSVFDNNEIFKELLQTGKTYGPFFSRKCTLFNNRYSKSTMTIIVHLFSKIKTRLARTGADSDVWFVLDGFLPFVRNTEYQSQSDAFINKYWAVFIKLCLDNSY